MLEWMKKRGSTVHKEAAGNAGAPTRPVTAARASIGRSTNYSEKRYSDTVVLTFRQLEDLLGFSLPETASTGGCMPPQPTLVPDKRRSGDPKATPKSPNLSLKERNCALLQVSELCNPDPDNLSRVVEFVGSRVPSSHCVLSSMPALFQRFHVG